MPCSAIVNGRHHERRDGALATDAFFAAPTQDVARGLIGAVVRRGACAGRIVETEAYTDDAASHFVTRPRSGAPLMGGTHARVYVYSIYGVHLCLNFTTDDTGPGAVLLRALEPVAGLGVMRRRRGVERVEHLASGPAKLARALGVTRRLSGRRVLEEFELVLPSTPVPAEATPRVGIRQARELPWRFVLVGTRFASRPG